MRKFQGAAILVAVALLLGMAPVAFAAGPGPYSDRHRTTGPLMSLGLSDRQLAQVRDLEKDVYAKTRKLRIQMMDTKFALRQLQLSNKVDQTAVDKKIRELQDLHTQITNNRQQARQKLKTILTPEQWDRLQASGGHFRGERAGGPSDER